MLRGELLLNNYETCYPQGLEVVGNLTNHQLRPCYKFTKKSGVGKLGSIVLHETQENSLSVKIERSNCLKL